MREVQNGGSLHGIRVLELGQAVAAPFCSQLLADHGADVIKVEPPMGDVIRGVAPFAKNDASRVYGSLFQSCNRNKRSIVLDLKQDKAQEAFLEMVGQADAVIENFRAGVMEGFGLGYEVLAERNPRLVYTSIRGFGDPRSGSTDYTTWPCVDIVAQAFSGLMASTGPDEDNPTMVGGVIGDTIPGLFAAFATLAALWETRSSGRGQYVDVAMVDALLAISGTNALTYSYTGEVLKPQGSRLPTIAPFGRVEAKDGWVVLATPPGRYWNDFCTLIGRPELIDDARFSSHAARVQNSDAAYEVVESFTRERTKAELLELFGAKIPFGPVNDSQDVFNDDYFHAREMLPQVEQPGAGHFSILGVPTKLLRTPGTVRHRAPLLGEHTDEILDGFGFSRTRIDQLHVTGAVAGGRTGG